MQKKEFFDINIQGDVSISESAVAFSVLEKQMEEALSYLSERERKILSLRFGIDDGKPRTYKEVGRVFDKSSSEIAKIEAQAFRKIRNIPVHNLQTIPTLPEATKAKTIKIADLEINSGIINITNGVSELIMKEISNDPRKLNNLNRRVFEEMIAEMFGKFGFDVELTRQTRDGGRDIIAIKNHIVSVKYLIECKRPDEGNKISVHLVRELLGVVKDEKATKGILATTGYFTKDATMLFERNKWILEPKDYEGIIEWVKDYKKIMGK